MNDSINGLHWVPQLRTAEPIVWQSPKQIIAVSSVYCPITDDHKATFIELRIYSRELMVMFTLYRGGSGIFLGGVHLSLALLQHQ